MFPSSASNVPIEVFERNSPVLINAKEYIQDSAGRGKFRGSPGERISMSRLAGHPHALQIYLHPHRLSFAAEGAFGGKPGTRTVVALNGEVLSDANSPMELGYVTLNDDADVLTVEFPSGAGMFDPSARDAGQVAEDLRNGIISSNEGD
jgi:N-methylhydantoinase B